VSTIVKAAAMQISLLIDRTPTALHATGGAERTIQVL